MGENLPSMADEERKEDVDIMIWVSNIKQEIWHYGNRVAAGSQLNLDGAQIFGTTFSAPHFYKFYIFPAHLIVVFHVYQ